MTTTNLDHLLASLEVAPTARYDLDQVANILGINLAQVRELIKKRRLKGFKGTPARWTGVLHADLAAYVLRLNGGAA